MYLTTAGKIINAEPAEKDIEKNIFLHQILFYKSTSWKLILIEYYNNGKNQ
jgi:hypothetical protein